MSIILISGENLQGRDRFDYRPKILRTLTEAAYFINAIEFPNGSLTQNRNILHLLYAEEPPISLEWRLNYHPERGILNYNEDATPISLDFNRPSLIRKFIEKVRESDNSLGILTMDLAASVRIIEYQWRNLTFQPNYLIFGLAIPNSFIQSS